MRIILILADESDDSVLMVTNHLRSKAADFIVFDTKKFPSEIKLSIKLDKHQFAGEIFLSNRVISISDIGVIWNRRIHRPLISPPISNKLLHNWVEEENYFVLESFLGMINNCAWMNPIFPEEKMRYNKIAQMIIAKNTGLEIPSSIISNMSNTVEEFCDSNISTIIKPLKTGFMYNSEDGQHILYTTEVPKDLLRNNLDRINICPVFFQEKIEKKVELRIVVVGEKVFACAIDSQSSGITATDWRQQIYLNKYLPHTIYNLPSDISVKCVRLVKQLGLLSGSIDMILTPDSRYVFLEINQNGQWGWIETLTGMPISEAIADLLIKKSSSQ